MNTQYLLAPRYQWENRVFFIFYALAGLYAIYCLVSGIDAWSGTDLTLTQRVCLAPLLLLVCLSSGMKSIYRGFIERLVISSRGMEYYAFGYTIYADWASIKNSGYSRLGFSKVEGLFVDYGTTDLKIWFPLQIPRKQDILIPLSMFSKNWRESEIGQKVEEYAPHLLSPVKS